MDRGGPGVDRDHFEIITKSDPNPNPDYTMRGLGFAKSSLNSFYTEFYLLL
jgi:hypothetical protein